MTGADRNASNDHLPLRLPLWYFGVGHAVLALTLAVTALDPEPAASMFLHPRTLAAVHAITLGFIAPAIFGATYIVAPLAFKMPLRATWVDGVACFLVLTGGSGVVSHFWLNGYSGIAWSGGTFAVGAIIVVVKLFAALARSAAPAVVRAPICIAWLNLMLAVALGTLVAIDKYHPLLPAGHLRAVFAHAHLASVGFATLMFVGVSYRLLPMFLPAAPPFGLAAWLPTVLIEIGLLGLASCLVLDSGFASGFAVITALGLAAFFTVVARMLRNPRPKPRALRRPDPGMVQALLAISYLVAAVVIGLVLSFRADLHFGWIAVYGVCGLIGFLSQAILGVAQRLFPVFAWTRSWSGSGYTELPRSPHAMGSRPLQFAALVLWVPGVPLLAYGVGTHAPTFVALGAWILLAGTLCATANTVRVLRVGGEAARGS